MGKRKTRTPKQQRKFKYNLKTRYGLSVEDFEALMKKQDYRCLICGYDNDKNLVVDHDHETKKIRGILCNFCNTALGKFKENIRILRRAEKYITKKSSLKNLSKRAVAKNAK